jgi:high affinity sulfate transporter 1
MSARADSGLELTMAETQTERAPSGIARIIPILDWLPRYDRTWFRADLVAGIAVAALVVPKSLGYAGIANVPIQHGLYAAAAGAILYAIFGTAKQIATGPSSALAAVAGSAVVVSGLGDEDAVALVAAITLLTGLLFLLLAIFRMGWVSQFLSKAVITGFLFGAAIEVVVGELPKLTGTSIEGSNSWQKLWSWLGTLDEIDGETLLLGLVSLVLIIGIRFSKSKVPGALVLVVGGLIASAVFGFEERGIAVVGDVPRGFAPPALPDLSFVVDNISSIGPAALGLLLIGFSQTAGDAREFASRHRYRVDINQESVAQGMANVGSGLLQGIPVSTSLSASSLNDESGAKSSVASLVTGIIIVLALLILAPLFSVLPNAVLAAIIIDAVVFGMMNVTEMKRLHRVARVDFWIAIAAILGVLAAGVLAGVIIGVVLSVTWLVYVAATPHIEILGQKPGTRVFRSVDEYPDTKTYANLLVVRVDASLHFVSSEGLEDQVRASAEQAGPDLETIVLDFAGVNYIDSQGSATMAEILELAGAYDLEVRLVRVQPAVLEVLRSDGVIETLGEDHVFGNVYTAVEDKLPDDARA